MVTNTNKQLKKEIIELKDLVNVLLNSWKSKHPEDFEPSKNIKLNKVKND